MVRSGRVAFRPIGWPHDTLRNPDRAGTIRDRVSAPGPASTSPRHQPHH